MIEIMTARWHHSCASTCCNVLITNQPLQGLAELMMSASVVLKHETSTLRQSHNYISIDLKLGVSYYVREVSWFGSDFLAVEGNHAHKPMNAS